MAARSPEIPGARFSEKNLDFFFEIHRTSDNSLGSAALLNHAYGLHRNITIQSSVYKVN